MHSQEARDLDRCVSCGEEIDAAEAMNVAISNSLSLCHGCARRFGGVYEPGSESWTRKPTLPDSYQEMVRHDR